jgi:hypothetical protein
MPILFLFIFGVSCIFCDCLPSVFRASQSQKKPTETPIISVSFLDALCDSETNNRELGVVQLAVNRRSRSFLRFLVTPEPVVLGEIHLG